MILAVPARATMLCLHKVFLNDGAARSAARSLNAGGNYAIRAYRCPDCGGWRVGRTEQFDKIDLHIIKLLAFGLRTRDISHDLQTTTKTINRRIDRMCRLTATNSRAELVAYAMYRHAVDYSPMEKTLGNQKRTE